MILPISASSRARPPQLSKDGRPSDLNVEIVERLNDDDLPIETSLAAYFVVLSSVHSVSLPHACPVPRYIQPGISGGTLPQNHRSGMTIFF